MKMTFTTSKDKTITKFLKELKLVAEYFKWTQPKTRECHVIRGYAQGRVFCPLAAVSYALYGVKIGCDEIAKACATIGLPLEAGFIIAQAADGGVAFDTEMGNLHERLLYSIGL